MGTGQLCVFVCNQVLTGLLKRLNFDAGDAC